MIARERSTQSERAREIQKASQSDQERAMEGKALVKSKILWQISLAHSAAHPALAFSGLLSDSGSVAFFYTNLFTG